MTIEPIHIRNANPGEFDAIGKLMVDAYSRLEGFPQQDKQPGYFAMLANIGKLTEKPETELLAAVDAEGRIMGAVVFFNDMKQYGAGGSASEEEDAAGFRLLAVDPMTRGMGIGRMLTMECIRKAKEKGRSQLIIHSTEPMKAARKIYEKLGFRRSEDLDFMVGPMLVYGFRLSLVE